MPISELQSLLVRLTNFPADERLFSVETLLDIQQDIDISRDYMHSAIRALLQTTPGETAEVRAKLNIAINRIKLVLAKPIFEELDCFCDSDIYYDILPEEQNDNLYKLMEIDSPAVVDVLIRRWISWIAIGGCLLQVDALALQVRTNLVRPVIDHLQANPLDDYLRDKLKPRNGINIFEHDLELIISQVNQSPTSRKRKNVSMGSVVARHLAGAGRSDNWPVNRRTAGIHPWHRPWRNQCCRASIF